MNWFRPSDPHRRDLLAAQAGDEPAFCRIYLAIAPDIQHYFSRRISDTALAEDLCSGVFMKSVEHLNQFDPQLGSARAWFFGIARNALRDHLRRRKNDPAPFQADARDETVSTNSSAPLPIDEHFIVHEQFQKASQALLELEPSDREIVTLRLFDELSHHEIAQLLNLRPATVRKRYSRALRCLQEILKPRSLPASIPTAIPPGRHE